MKRATKIGLIIGGAVLLFALTVVANISRSRSQVRGIEVSIRHSRTPQLVSEQTVADSIKTAMPDIMGTRVADVNREQVTTAAMRVSFIEEVAVSMSVSGKVVVKAQQRRPIARLFYGNRELYIDRNGVVFPTSQLADCNVLVMGGDFNEPLCPDSLNSQLTELLKVAVFLDQKEQYGVLIDQIYSESDGDIMMVSKLGDNVIELGSADDLNTKFSNLWTFYRRGMPRTGWNTYSKISLKYEGQVVCTKK